MFNSISCIIFISPSRNMNQLMFREFIINQFSLVSHFRASNILHARAFLHASTLFTVLCIRFERFAKRTTLFHYREPKIVDPYQPSSAFIHDSLTFLWINSSTNFNLSCISLKTWIHLLVFIKIHASFSHSLGFHQFYLE